MIFYRECDSPCNACVSTVHFVDDRRTSLAGRLFLDDFVKDPIKNKDRHAALQFVDSVCVCITGCRRGCDPPPPIY